jgi:hypothetical protein
MTNVSELVASVLYQDVQIAQNLAFSEVSVENAVLEIPEPLPVASELSVRIVHPDGQVLGQAVVTRVRESRASGEAGQMHLRWVEFTDADFAMLAGWVSASDVQPPKKPKSSRAAHRAAHKPDPVVVPEADPVVVPEADPGVASDEAPVVGFVPQPVVEEDERTIPIDPGTTVLELPAVSDELPGEDPAAHEDAGGEEISVVDEDGASSEGEDGASSGGEDGAEKKKRRRRTKKK